MREKLVIKTGCTVRTLYECPLPHVIFIVEYTGFLCSPAVFKLYKPFIFRFCSPETKTLISVLTVPLYCFPHNKVVRPEMLIVFVRSPIFIQRFFSKMEKDSAGNGFFTMRCKCNKTEIFGNNVFINFFKKIIRLWGETMFSSCQTIQAVKFLY